MPVNEFTHPTGTTFTSNTQDQVVTACQWQGCPVKACRHRQVGRRRDAAWEAASSGAFFTDPTIHFGMAATKIFVGSTAESQRSCAPFSGLPEEQWLNMMVARDGHIWLRGSLHVGELVPDGSRFELRDIPGVLKPESFPALAEDVHGRILTTQGSNLALWEKDHWRIVTERNGLSPFELQALFVDREGSIWIGVVGHGLLRWVGEDRWEGYTADDGIGDNLVWASIRDHEGRLWIGTESGLSWIPSGGNTPQQWRAPGLQISDAGALEVSADGAIWMGSSDGHLTRIDPKTLAGSQWNDASRLRNVGGWPSSDLGRDDERPLPV